MDIERKATVAQVTNFIKDLLGVPYKWSYHELDLRFELTITDQDSFSFVDVQKAVYDWLSVPERKANFELLAKEEAPDGKA